MQSDQPTIDHGPRGDYELHSIHTGGSHLSYGRHQDAEIREPVDPPSNAVSDSTPTRGYQALLLLSGFTMIFWIIGLNSVYGIFQAS